MSPPPTSSAVDFLDIAVELGFLPAGQLDDLRSRLSNSGQSAAQLVASAGLLDATQVDIVETLAAPQEVIPGYRVRGLIGKGGMGVVYRAEQLNLSRTVALKTILVSRMAERGTLERFELEARTIGQLRHPNIIAAHDFGRHAGRVYLAMELVEGIDLDRRIKSDGPLPEPLVWGLARQAASGLAHALQHHVVHRDIKPANLMLVPPPEGYPLPPEMPMVKIADFGLALLQEDVAPDTRLTAPDSTVGSPHYMAPEQLESSAVDHRADLYALGATVFHALTGRPPFSGLKLSQLIAAKLGTGAPPIGAVRTNLHAATCQLVDRLLSRDPELRPPDYRTLLGEIDAVIAAVGSQLPAPGALGRYIPPPQSSRSTATSTLQAAPTLIGTQLTTSGSQPGVNYRRRRRWIAAMAIAIAALGGGLWWTQREGASLTPPVRSERRLVGDAVPLFDGETLAGWQPLFGHWGIAPDEPILSGTDGLIARPLPPQRRLGLTAASRPDDPPLFYRLDLMVRGVSDHRTAEIEFGLSQSPGGEVICYVLRRDGTGVQVGRRRGDRGEFEQEAVVSERSLAATADIAIEIERLPSGWFISVNGVEFAALPLEVRPLPQFRLRATGVAQFAELYLQPLVTESPAAAGGGP